MGCLATGSLSGCLAPADTSAAASGKLILSPAPFQEPSPSPSPSPSIDLSQAILQISQDFEANIRPIVQKGCMECHDSQASPEGFLGLLPIARQIEWSHIHNASRVLDFSKEFPNWAPEGQDPSSTLAQIKTVIENSTMPLTDFRFFHETDGKLLTFEEQDAVVEWVDRSSHLLSEAEPVPTAMTASHFIANGCMDCHDVGDGAGGLSFAFAPNGDVILPKGKASNGIPFVDRMNPENSAIYLVLLPDPDQRQGLPQMPKDGGTATDAQRQLIYDWISQGN